MNYEDFEELAVAIINNHTGFLPEQKAARILHTQFALAEVYSRGYSKGTSDLENFFDSEGVKND